VPSVARGETITLTLTAEPATEGGPTPTLADVEVDIINPSAVAVVTDAPGVEDSQNEYHYDYAVAADAPPGDWTAHWTGTVNGTPFTEDETFEVTAGVEEGHYFTVAEAREFRGGKLSSEAKFPDADIEAARSEVEQYIEQITDRAFVVRTKTVQLDGSGGYEVVLPDLRVNAVTAVTTTDTSGTETVYEAADLADLWVTEYGFIRRKTRGVFPAGHGNVEVTYTYGETTPLPIKRAALILLYNRLLPSDISDRAQSFTNESGTLNYSSPNGQRPTGIPEVDAILAKYSDNRVGIA
jgi:hypothetical protein